MIRKRGTGSQSLLLVMIVAALLISAIVYIYYGPKREDANDSQLIDCQTNKDCFIQQVNACKPAIATGTMESITFRYNSTGNCSIQKTVTFVSAEEPPTTRTLLEGKRVICAYERGKFDNRLIQNMTLGMENCSGELKDAFEALAQQYAARLDRARESEEVFEELIVNTTEIS